MFEVHVYLVALQMEPECKYPVEHVTILYVVYTYSLVAMLKTS